MARVLCVWELGDYLGHMAGFSGLAEEFRRRGHEVLFALRDLSAAEQVFGTRSPYRFLQAPVFFSQAVRMSRSPVSYAEILQCYGYLDAAILRYLVKAWRALFELSKPDLVLFDYAPTALLASRGMGFPRATVNSGFFSPPRQSPFPAFVNSAKISIEQLSLADHKVLTAINEVMRTEGMRPLDALHELFDVDQTFLTTLPELDHYNRLEGRHYYGITSSGLGGALPEWRTTGKRVFGYLKGAYTNLDELLACLLE